VRYPIISGKSREIYHRKNTKKILEKPTARTATFSKFHMRMPEREFSCQDFGYRSGVFLMANTTAKRSARMKGFRSGSDAGRITVNDRSGTMC